LKINIIDNHSKSLSSILSQRIIQSNDIRIAVAFLSMRGINLLYDSIDSALNQGASFEFLAGLDMRTTEPEALQFLYNLSKNNANLTLYCYASIEPSSIYHPKIYLLKNINGMKVIAIVGSSNLTEGGLRRNIEANLVIEADVDHEIIVDSYLTYNRLKFHPKRVIPDDDFLSLYSELCSSEKKQRREFNNNKSMQFLLKAFEKKTKELNHPKPALKDLMGWAKLVFEYLPDKEFSTDQIYSHEQEFSNIYPGNKNIRAKIRQQLQVLRDIGLIKHLGKSHWVKVEI
jgi:HKD family nuclease